MTDSRVGKLLIAHPNLNQNDYFHKSVILIYADKPSQGTLGIVINKPIPLTVGELCAMQNIIFPSKQTVHLGGPISGRTICMVHSNEWTTHSSYDIPARRISVSSDNLMFDKMSTGVQPAYWRITSGLCSWAPGQLDMELKGLPPYKPENSWLTCDANDHIMFELDGEEQWEAALNFSSKQMISQYI